MLLYYILAFDSGIKKQPTNTEVQTEHKNKYATLSCGLTEYFIIFQNEKVIDETWYCDSGRYRQIRKG